jgi:multidrug efflux system membrane fusion protein
MKRCVICQRLSAPCPASYQQESIVKARSVLLLLSVIGTAALLYGVARNWLATPPAGGMASAGGFPAGLAPTGVPATVAQSATRDVPIWLSGIGSIVSLNVVTVKPRVDGQLARVLFTEGQEVHTGDILATIDPRQYQAALDQAVAKQAQDQATLANARVDLIRYQKLAANAYTSAQQADTQKTMVAQLEAQVRQDEAVAAMARLQLDFTTITTPVDGRVGLRLVDPGNVVHSADPSGILTITQMAPIAALFAVSQDHLPDVLSAMTRGDVAVVVYSRDGLRRLANGKLVFVDSQVDQATGQIRLKAVFDNADRVLWPGQFITAQVLVSTMAHVTVVPANAIERGQEGPYVFRVGPGDIVETRPVSVGPVTDTVAVIMAGLAPGDRIVVGGQYRLRPGTRIEVRTAGNVPRP